MLKVIMSLEEGISSKELDENTSNTPYITRKTPTKVKNDFGSTIMSCRDDGGVIFIVECGRPKVDKPDLRVEQDFSVTRGAGSGGRGGRDVAVIRECLIRIVDKQDVFRFQISVDQVKVVKN